MDLIVVLIACLLFAASVVLARAFARSVNAGTIASVAVIFASFGVVLGLSIRLNGPETPAPSAPPPAAAPAAPAPAAANAAAGGQTNATAPQPPSSGANVGYFPIGRTVPLNAGVPLDVAQGSVFRIRGVIGPSPGVRPVSVLATIDSKPVDTEMPVKARSFSAALPVGALELGAHQLVFHVRRIQPDGTASAAGTTETDVPLNPGLTLMLTSPPSIRERLPSANDFYGSVDRFGVIAANAPPSTNGKVVAGKTDTLTVEGWSADQATQSPTSEILIVAGALVFRAETGLARPDVAQTLKVPQYATTGYRALIPLGAVAPGLQTVRVIARARDGKSYHVFPKALLLDRQ